jgi:hypothetical protein
VLRERDPDDFARQPHPAEAEVGLPDAERALHSDFGGL